MVLANFSHTTLGDRGLVVERGAELALDDVAKIDDVLLEDRTIEAEALAHGGAVLGAEALGHEGGRRVGQAETK
jgi:hypothetical protein